jgi:hypothetical protein
MLQYLQPPSTGHETSRDFAPTTYPDRPPKGRHGFTMAMFFACCVWMMPETALGCRSLVVSEHHSRPGIKGGKE